MWTLNSMSLGEINENVKLAREYALLGNYNSAVVCYQGVLEQIKKYQYSVRDSSLQQKWQQVRVSPAGHCTLPDLHKHLAHYGMFLCWLCLCIQVWQEINEETKHVREIMTTLESFQQQESTPSKPSSFSQENDIMPVHVEHRYVVWKNICLVFNNGCQVAIAVSHTSYKPLSTMNCVCILCAQ